MILAQVETNSQVISTGTDGGPLARGTPLSYRISPAWPQPANDAVPGQGSSSPARKPAVAISPCAASSRWFLLVLLALAGYFVWRLL